jgi:superfamily II DNA or RNA helicase/DNA-binding XRE family transcriptional regulator
MDPALRIKSLRSKLGLTQVRLAELMGVSFATVNRWENGSSTPSRLAAEKLARAEQYGLEGFSETATGPASAAAPGPREHALDFSADAEEVRLVIEAERLSYGHLFNPAFATEISLIDPLPHQRIAVYKRMVPQARLRFLLADDAGAGKTIMAGLYIREMLARRLVRRVLVVPPAGLVGNWERELRRLFSLSFNLIVGPDARAGNPFTGPDSDLAIVSVDTLAGPRMFERIQDSSVSPYDLVIFDEAHKLSARKDPDGTFRPTDRYRLAEALAGVRGLDPRWRLGWSANHLLLLTATPHMGKDFPYYCLWRLLEPQVLSTEAAFAAFPPTQRAARFIRRVKEEMVHFDGRPIYPQRISDTLSYDLTEGTDGEQQLYRETTDYIEHYYNQARILNRSAARFAVSVFQRRLASSSWALLCSLKKRDEKLGRLIDALRAGEVTEDQLRLQQARMDKDARDPLDATTADEETAEAGRESHEREEEELLGGVIAVSLAQLIVERERVEGLIALAERVHDRGEESKFEKLREVLRDPRFAGEKVIIFTEHRDTQDFLARRFQGLGFTGRIAQINGGMDFREREAQVEQFRKPPSEGGAQYLICTDAAGEGINLQFAWLMVNYDIPWNPARLEQRMGRIHRYGQKRDPVVIVNLVAGKTREGRVLRVLLDKLERIRKELGSDKVFDVVGRLFEGISLREYMERATLDEKSAERALDELDGKLTKEQVEAIDVIERRIYGEGGDVRSQLEELRGGLSNEELRRILPGYVMRFIDKAAPKLGLEVEGDLHTRFAFDALRRGALDRILPLVETYPPEARSKFTVFRPDTDSPAIFLHPGEPVFEALRQSVRDEFAGAAQRGAAFVDPTTTQPYLFHVGLASVVRQADEEYAGLQRPEALEYRLVGLRQETDGVIATVPVEHLLLLRGGDGLPPSGIGLLALSQQLKENATQYLRDKVAQPLAEAKRAEMLAQIEDRELFLRRGFDYQEAELAAARSECAEKARAGDARARADLNEIRGRQRELAGMRDDALRQARREPELIAVGAVDWIAHALVVPSTRAEDRKHRDDAIEAIAMQVALAHELARGANAKDVSTPALARLAGLTDYPGFDVHSKHPTGEERAIEVKGRAAVGEIEISENEWARALNLRDRYWLYVVFDCGTPTPCLYRIQDPFSALLVRAKGGVIIQAEEIVRAETGDGG